MEKVLEKEIDAVEDAKLQRVPFFIRVPGMKGGINHEVGGQIDILPTMLHLLGVDTKNHIHFGTDLFSKEHQQLIPFRNGDFVTPDIINVDDAYYDSETGLVIEDEAILEKAKEFENNVQEILRLSDEVVNSDLLRFYDPDNPTLIKTNP